MDKNLAEGFQSSIKNGIVTGSLKFSNKFVSQIQIYFVVKGWSEDDKGVIYASIKYKSILYDFIKPLFEEKLGGDYIQAWSISRESVIVK